MSNTPENDLNLDLHFLPAWAQQSPDINRYANFTGNEGSGDRGRPRRDWGNRPPGGGGGGGGAGGPRRDRGPRPQGQGQGPSRGPGAGAGAAPGRSDRGADFRPGRGGPRPGPGFARRDEAPPAPVLELNLSILPDEKGVDSLARQIKMSGRAYPLFEIATMILKRSDRHSVAISTKRKSDGTVAQPLFSCALDESLWLSDSDAIKHALDNHFATFYQTDKVPVDPPKGVYTFVGQCGMSGVILGPPNHHDYQNQLRRLHSERFAQLPFEAFKARVKIVRDEAVVKKWVEDQSFKAEYTCLNVAEPLKLPSREEVEKHFREVHVPTIIRPVDAITLTQEAMAKLRNPVLLRAIRGALDGQRRFPLQVATHLSQQFATRSLQFFKVNKTVTHVSVARPHYLDLETNVVTPGVRKIVDYINANTGCTRRKLVDAMVPGGMPATPPPAAAAPAAAAAGAPAADAAPAPEKAPLSPELQAFASDLHWLIHQGHVIEFATGVMETAKKPIIKPPTPPKAAAPAANTKAAVAAPAPIPAPAPAPAPTVEAEAASDSVVAEGLEGEGAPSSPA